MIKLVLAVALGVPLAMYLLQDRLIFLPRPVSDAQRARIAERHAHAQSLFIEAADGARLHGWYIPPAPDAPLALYFGGNAEEVSWMLAQAPPRAPGIGWLLIDYRGYGSSEGRPSEEALVADALRWHDHASERLAARRIVLFGRSLGSGVAVQLASARPVEAVILVAPFDSLVALGRHYYPFLPVNWMLRHRFDSAALAPQLDVPLLCLAAERDEVIPAARSRSLYDAWGGPKRWVELRGAGHNSTDDAPAFWQAIREFLDDTHGARVAKGRR